MPAGQTGEQAESVSFSGGEVEFYTAQSLLPRYDRDLADQYDPSSTTKFTTTQLRWVRGSPSTDPIIGLRWVFSATIGDDGELKRAAH